MSWAVWITGPPGSGKSTIARAVETQLADRGHRVKRLELDEIRRCLTPAPRYSDAERDVVYRALGWLATLLVDTGVPVIIDATAHRRVWRDLVRRAVPAFAEVELACPLELRQERERARPVGHAPAGIYARAGQQGATVPGVDVPYESAVAPELRIDTGALTVAESARRIVDEVERLHTAATGPPPAPGEPAAGWALWVAGRAGSGKSTLVARVVDGLRRGARPHVLEYAAVRDRLLGHRPACESGSDMVHRALAYGAKLLTEAGVAVIVDAAAPRREWRDVARELIPAFAEIQLLCPASVCIQRSARRGPASRGASGGARRPSETAVPDVEWDFEESQHAELTIRTEVEDAQAAAARVLLVVRRLAGPGGSG